ncbi:alanine--tRNA ligase [Abyssisolibacter fermentans]|uniref:alanine--tRNA ligase n=1 Tax=Abyssisolibacter fermentans TaxID=1766203 RepID=UPI00082E05C7|nr:alanine--tRNA ligase [Abyssisolibacter fermentans]
MKQYNLNQVRKEFLDFFKEKDHYIADSYSLVPKNDKSLLLINAGMAPLKAYFLGTAQPPKKRMATCQKCIRTGDIDNVGKTDRHGTFFEMLGNFSFGDYFKKEIIKWAWEFMTQRIEIPEELLWVTVFHEDDEAFDIWKNEVGISPDRIVRLGKEDNFWEHGLGPCGPCSEIYIDRGEKYSCGDPNCKPGCDCDRFVEVWNLVFSQFDKDEDGNYNPLPNPNIDTGMGLERMVCVLNDASNIFEIEPISSIIKNVENISGKKYGENKAEDVSIRVIIDHLRAMTFLVSDGVIPSNEGRGYVLRRLIRRAARHGKLLGIEGEFLYKLSEIIIDNWGEYYPNLVDKKVQIKKVIQVEEQKFQETIDQGMNILKEFLQDMSKKGDKVLEGVKAFKLYDTYGFPLDLTKEILDEKGYTVDEEGFNNEMEEQRQRARNARANGDFEGWNRNSQAKISNDVLTEFIGYENKEATSKVILLIKDNVEVDSLKEGEDGIIILDQTVFYPEGGGQVSDRGILFNDNFKCELKDVKKIDGNKILHFVSIESGIINVGQKVHAEINEKKRMNTARNHTATHLLHRALKDVLGEHVNQAGSLVDEEKLRFDFTHFQGVAKEELSKIEDIVNERILDCLDISITTGNMDEARKMGAVALFDEKYGDKVRIVKMGNYSIELCGGTHLSNTSQVQIFKIVSEGGIASGVRRIEAITGEAAFKNIKNTYKAMDEVANKLKTIPSNVLDKLKNSLEENKSLSKKIESLKAKMAVSKVDDIIKDVITMNDLSLVVKQIDGLEVNDMRNLCDEIKNKITGDVLIVLGTVKNDKVNFVASATKPLTKKGIHAGNIIREVAKATGGGGGGRPDMATAGGKDPSKVKEALDLVENLVRNSVK